MLGFSLTEIIGVSAICYITYCTLYRLAYDLYVHFWGAANTKERVKALGNWAVITGATSGIGLRWTHLMASWGLDLILLGVPQKMLVDLAKDIHDKYGVQAISVYIDFTSHDADDYESLRKAVVGKEVAILFNNAGAIYNWPDYFDKISPKLLATIVDVNCKGLTLVAHTVLQECILKRQKGIVLNMSSHSCTYGCPLFSVYAASKRYVKDLTEQLAYEYSHLKNVQFQYFTPAFICTNMTKYSDKMNKPSLNVPSPEQFINEAKLTLGMGLRSTGFFAHTVAMWIGLLLPRRFNIWLNYQFMDYFRRHAIKDN